jgi:hypothetical protein
MITETPVLNPQAFVISLAANKQAPSTPEPNANGTFNTSQKMPLNAFLQHNGNDSSRNVIAPAKLPTLPYGKSTFPSYLNLAPRLQPPVHPGPKPI